MRGARVVRWVCAPCRAAARPCRRRARPAVTVRLLHAVLPTRTATSADAPASGSCDPGTALPRRVARRGDARTSVCIPSTEHGSESIVHPILTILPLSWTAFRCPPASSSMRPRRTHLCVVPRISTFAHRADWSAGRGRWSRQVSLTLQQATRSAKLWCRAPWPCAVHAAVAAFLLCGAAPAATVQAQDGRPSAPQNLAAENLAAEPGDTVVKVTWSPPADDGGSDLTGYQMRGGSRQAGHRFRRRRPVRLRLAIWRTAVSIRSRCVR